MTGCTHIWWGKLYSFGENANKFGVQTGLDSTLFLRWQRGRVLCRPFLHVGSCGEMGGGGRCELAWAELACAHSKIVVHKCDSIRLQYFWETEFPRSVSNWHIEREQNIVSRYKQISCRISKQFAKWFASVDNFCPFRYKFKETIEIHDDLTTVIYIHHCQCGWVRVRFSIHMQCLLE